MGKRVQQAACGHEGSAGGYREVEKRHGGVILGRVGGGVEGLGEVWDGSGFSDKRPGLCVELGHEPQLAKGLGSCLFRHRAQFRNQRPDRLSLHLHFHSSKPYLKISPAKPYLKVPFCFVLSILSLPI